MFLEPHALRDQNTVKATWKEAHPCHHGFVDFCMANIHGHIDDKLELIVMTAFGHLDNAEAKAFRLSIVTLSALLEMELTMVPTELHDGWLGIISGAIWAFKGLPKAIAGIDNTTTEQYKDDDNLHEDNHSGGNNTGKAKHALQQQSGDEVVGRVSVTVTTIAYEHARGSNTLPT
ncbi:hypothetical protein EI94DRAFT_1698241 [Lactarius quietus]|nr:hypothetical protein EI94DRAFT_1698241 [Lactarius quietus]